MYLKGTTSSPLVLTKLWQVNSDFFIKSILELYGNDGTSLSRILDIVHELKVRLLSFVIERVSLPTLIISLVATCYFEHPTIVLCFGPGSSGGSSRIFEFGEMVAGQDY